MTSRAIAFVMSVRFLVSSAGAIKTSGLEKFAFTVRDPAVATQLNNNIGRRLTLHYDQHKWIPNSCFGETEYWVTGVKVAEQPTPQ